MFGTLDTGALLQIGLFVMAGIIIIAVLILFRKPALKIPTGEDSQRALLRNKAEVGELLAQQAKSALPVPPSDSPTQKSQSTIVDLEGLTPREFEEHVAFVWNNFVGPVNREAAPLEVAHIYSRLGYKTSLIKPSDQGVDVIAESSGQRIAINCKRGTVGDGAVHAVYAGARRYNCNRTVVVTASLFTQEAKKLAEITGTELIDGAKYQKLVYQTSNSGDPPRPAVRTFC